MNKYEKDEYFESVYRATFTSVSKFLFFKTNNISDAEDLVQSVYTQFYQYTVLKNKRPENVKAYIFQIANHTLAEYYRNKSKIDFELLADENVIESIASDENLEGDVFDRFDADHLWEVVLKLNPMEQKIVVAKFRYDMTFAEIAAALESNESTVKVRYYRLLKKLRNLMESETI